MRKIAVGFALVLALAPALFGCILDLKAVKGLLEPLFQNPATPSAARAPARPEGTTAPAASPLSATSNSLNPR